MSVAGRAEIEDSVAAPIHPQEPFLWAHAECKGQYEPFLDARSHVVAKTICAHCKVFDLCREVGDHVEGRCTDHRRIGGVWAGETPRERAERRKKWRRSTGTSLRTCAPTAA